MNTEWARGVEAIIVLLLLIMGLLVPEIASSILSRVEASHPRLLETVDSRVRSSW